MKIKKLFALTLCTILFLSACNTADMHEAGKENEALENIKNESSQQLTENETDMPEDISSTIPFIEGSYFNGDATIKLSADGNFEILVENTVPYEDLDDDITFHINDRITGTWELDGDTYICTETELDERIYSADEYSSTILANIKNKYPDLYDIYQRMFNGEFVAHSELGYNTYVTVIELKNNKDSFEAVKVSEYDNEDGDIVAEFLFENNTIKTQNRYYATGNLHYSITYENGKPVNTEYYDVDGNLEEIE